ncbi:MAG TPA: nucleotide exchange factor GrpE [Gemmatimonadaceae bacterium]|nr:nucleotide exchange factor GrpE [Gemmatimonadaceae bacterium]
MRRNKDRMADSTTQDDFLNGDGVPATDAAATPAPLVDTDEGAAAVQDQDGIGDRISELQRDLTTERDKLLRLAAEFDNYRKRMMRERLEAEARGKAELVKDILEPLDDIARFAHVDPAVTDSTTLAEGVAMVERKLEKTLRTAGLEPMNPVGEPFDPARHEAVGTEPAVTPDEDGTVGRVYQIGYTFKGQLLRPARVVVRQFTDAD